MPRQRGKRRPTAAVRRVSWERGQGGRLDRLARAAHYVSEDLLVYDIDSVNWRAVERHTSAQSLPPLPKQSREPGEGDWFSQLARFGRLDPVLAFLGVRDMQALHGVNRFLAFYIDSQFLVQLSLPLPPSTVSSLQGRRLLSLTSCCNLAWLPAIQTFQPFKQLNLTQLRQLKLIGKNIDLMNHPSLGFSLSPTYHRSLSHLLSLLSSSPTLQKLEILTDSTQQSMEAAKSIKLLVNLEEVVLHGIGHFNNSATYPIDVNMSNLIIERVLENKRIRVLKLVKFEVSEYHFFNKLNIKSHSLRELAILQSKVIKLGDIELPELRILETDISTYIFDFYINNEMKATVESACPKLETWNGRDLASLARESGTGSWAGLLRFEATSSCHIWSQ